MWKLCEWEKIFIKTAKKELQWTKMYVHLCETIFALVVHNECLVKAISNKQFMQPFSGGGIDEKI